MNSLVFFLSLEKGKEYLIDHVGWLIVLLANMLAAPIVNVDRQRKKGQQTRLFSRRGFLLGSW